MVRSVPGIRVHADQGNQVAVKAVKTGTSDDEGLKSHEKVALVSPTSWN